MLVILPISLYVAIVGGDLVRTHCLKRIQPSLQDIQPQPGASAWGNPFGKALLHISFFQFSQRFGHLPVGWRMMEESAAHESETANRIVWPLQVPAGGKARLTYRLRVTRP